ncbi:hypothetical protein ACOBV8_21185 (plasmid) [Pseudoalteromonas espejiana]
MSLRLLGAPNNVVFSNSLNLSKKSKQALAHCGGTITNTLVLKSLTNGSCGK